MTALIEADLFDTISDLLAEQHTFSSDERRDGERREYEYIQLIAPYGETGLPQQENFRQVRCHDLSPRGFSFLSYQRPSTDNVVALGSVPFKFFVAKIAHVSSSENASAQDYLVGWRFVRRLTEDDA